MTSEWHEVPLRELVGYISKGIAPSYAEEASETTIRVLNQKCNRNFRISYGDSRLHDTLKKKVPPERYVKPDDILINSTGAGTAGRIAQIEDVPSATTIDGHMILIRSNGKVTQKFLGYALKAHQWEVLQLDEGSTGQTELNRDRLLDEIMINYPVSFDEQNAIVSTLESIDRKLIVNEQLNDNLQQQAAALFESWFVNYDPWDGVQPSEWENAPLGSFVEIKRGGSPRPIQDFLSDSGLRWLKISDVTSLSSPFVLEIKEHIKEEGLRKTVFLHAGELVLSNSATPGIPKILDVDTCIHDGWLYFPKSELSKYYLYLFFKHIRKELVALGNGSVFTNLKTDILKAFPATKADESTLKEFDALVTPLFDAMLNADRENFKLAAMRDALLPKLMSSEIDVSEVEL